MGFSTDLVFLGWCMGRGNGFLGRFAEPPLLHHIRNSNVLDDADLYG
jgi:hypothetical protein